MGSRFIPPPDQINTISSKKSKKSFSDLSGQSIFHEIKRNIRDSYKYDAFEQVGQLNAIVLEVIETDITKMLWRNPLMSYAYNELNTVPDYIEVRYRVPEIHAHLPEPESAEDFAAINRHPKAIMKKDKGIPEVGDIITLDFKDKNNFTHAMVIESLNSNQGPNPGGNCSPAGVFGSATPPLNMAQPTGDSQVSSPESYSAKNDPASEAFENGIDYTEQTPLSELTTKLDTDQIKKHMYLISIDSFNTMSEFKDISKVADVLASKNIYSVCFRVANSDRLLRDTDRLIKIINKLSELNFNCSLMMNSPRGDIPFRTNFIHMADIAKQTKLSSIIYEAIGVITSDAFEKRDKIFRKLADSLEINYYISATEDTNIDGNNKGLATETDKVFMTANKFDYNDNDQPTLLGLYVESIDGGINDNMIFSGVDYHKLAASIYLSGQNFLANFTAEGEISECLAGRRNSQILSSDARRQQGSSKNTRHYIKNEDDTCLFYNYEALDASLIDVIVNDYKGENMQSSEKQNLLSSNEVIKKPEKANVTDIQGTEITPTIEQPSFNSGSGGTQTPSAAPVAPGAPSSPGAQCTPIDGGAFPAGDTNAAAAGSGAPVTPPSYRFDSIENYQNLGWTASAHHIINDVIFEYMERFSAAVYRRLPANSPSFTGSVPKKIRLTSTARTAAKQVELMWDKIRQGGDNAVWSLYGQSSWVQTVVTGYHNNDSATPIGVIQGRIDSGVVTGHLSGKGIDVHTWSHLDAEGISSSGASVATMNSSKFVKAVVEAARECGGRPVVESYQQHVHITIL